MPTTPATPAMIKPHACIRSFLAVEGFVALSGSTYQSRNNHKEPARRIKSVIPAPTAKAWLWFCLRLRHANEMRFILRTVYATSSAACRMATPAPVSASKRLSALGGGASFSPEPSLPPAPLLGGRRCLAPSLLLGGAYGRTSVRRVRQRSWRSLTLPWLAHAYHQAGV